MEIFDCAMTVKLLILLSLAGIAACAGFQGVVAGLAKKIFVQSTSDRFVIPIVTSLTTVPSTCFITVNVTGHCRRRRSFQENPLILALDDEDVDIDTILPTLPRLETTAIQTSSAPELESGQDENQRGWTFTANLAGLTKNRWMTNPGFGLTYVDLKTVTITQTAVSTVTFGRKIFIVSGCLPSGFVYPTC